MADSGGNLTVSETDISVLKEALCTQQQLLQKLHVELDVEREAAATAASEALSMILRLQGEKAAVKMEASQYKRLAEEKIGHAEESLAVFEELIYMKEMEISSLEYQVEAYRYKLLSLGFGDLGSGESKFPENLLLQSDVLFGGMGVNGNVRKLKSMPVTCKDFKSKSFDCERSAVPEMDLDLIHGVEEEKFEQVVEKSEQVVNEPSSEVTRKPCNSGGGDFNYYWEQIRKLDEWVKEITDGKDSSGIDKPVNPKVESRSCSLISHKSSNSSLDPARAKIHALMGEMKSLDDSKEREVVPSSSCASSVQDIFEVSEINGHQKTWANLQKARSKLNLEESKRRLGKANTIAEETFELPTKDETEWEKKILPVPMPEKRACKPTNGMSLDHKVSLGQLTIGIAQCKDELQRVSKRVELLEGERNNTRQEIRIAGGEEINLLKQIQEQLSSMQSEITSLLPKKPPPPDDSSLISLKEGMLYFWL
ncbi:hypothetical protein SLEP1_g49545 [Rubroshorea leprosula]|uniref:GTD-binding domain-containing protein n=1 Tax=Rubroshorea leprosula TaxID=152421 RepID=A0AAV5LY46_9ROSI|nr:hypothetical protein SLEP1_g49545 [Rubroshorea leprosula]